MTYSVQPGATATYEYGTLVAVSAVANGPDTVTLTTGSVEVASTSVTVPGGPSAAVVVCDGAETRGTYTFGDGAVAALSYTIPWAQVDSAQANQTLVPSAFKLNLAGQNFALGAGFVQQPALHFKFGEFVGVTYVVNPSPGFAYTSVVGTFDGTGANIAQAVKTGTGQQFVAAPVPQQEMVLNFADFVTGEAHFITEIP